MALLAVALCWAYAQAAPSPEVVKGVAWLQSQAQTDGSLFNEPFSIATPLQNRAEVLQTLAQLATPPASLVANVSADAENSTEFLARRIISLKGVGRDVAPLAGLLSARQNADGGFGGAPGYASNALDTAWVLLALRAANNADANLFSRALGYLLSIQETGGGFALSGNSASLYLSALVSSALQVSSRANAVLDAVNRVNAWLLSQQKADGSWGDVSETSVVYLALLGTTSDAGLQSRVGVFLLSLQGADGSWGGDPFATALALRALVAQPRPVPTTGDIVGRVFDASTGAAIFGASAAIQGFSTTSDFAGTIHLIDIPAGSYTLLVSAQGYAPKSLAFSLQAGTTLDLQQIMLAPAPAFGLLQGKVTDALTGAPLAEVLISVAGGANASVLTAADGTYRLTDLAPGAVTVSASKTGYDAVGGAGTLVAGGTLLFSPALQFAGTGGGTTGNIRGQVVDAATQTALAGVIISLDATGLSVTSGADGRFELFNIPAGTYSVSFALGGYHARSLNTLISAGAVVDFQIVGLNKLLTAVVVYGKLTAATTHQPIAQATVSVLGTTLTAKTDANGDYRLEGLSVGDATLRFSAAGYASETLLLNFPAPGEYPLDRILQSEQGSTLRLLALGTEKTHYQAYETVSAQVKVLNSGLLPISAIVRFDILNSEGSVVNSQEASWFDANGVAQNLFDFQPGAEPLVVSSFNTGYLSPGVYGVVVRIIASNVIPNTGIETRTTLAEGITNFTIDATSAIQGIMITPLPGFVNFNAVTDINFSAQVTNRSNIPISLSVAYKLLAPSGLIVHQGNGIIPLAPNDALKSLNIGSAQLHFAESGVYAVDVQITEGPVPASIVGGTISVAPGIRIEPTQSISPQTVTPDGDKRIHINIHLKGVEEK